MNCMICPWWLGYLLVNPLRRWAQDPQVLLAPYVSPGMTVLEPGPGMGYFTLDLARLVGPAGRVVVVDVQAKMLDVLRDRARRKGIQDRIDARQVRDGGLGVEDLAGRVDFALAFAMVHEVPDMDRFFAEVHAALKPGGRVLLAEPTHHVVREQFDRTLASAQRAGLRVDGRPAIRWSWTAVLAKAG